MEGMEINFSTPGLGFWPSKDALIVTATEEKRLQVVGWGRQCTYAGECRGGGYARKAQTFKEPCQEV